MNWEKIDEQPEQAIIKNNKNIMPDEYVSDGSTPLKNQRQELFCQNVAGGKTKMDAYVMAGYKAKESKYISTNASILMRKEGVQQRITYLQKQISSNIIMKNVASKQELAEYYTRLLRTTVADFLEYDKDGERYFSIKDGTLSKEAIKKIKCRTIRDQEGNIKDEKQIEEIELVDRLAAGRELANLMGYNTAVADQMPASLKEFLDGIAKDCMKLPKDSEELPPSPFKEVRLKIAGGGGDTSSTED